MKVDIEVDNGSLSLEVVPVSFMPEVEGGPGWFDSSRALRQGLDVVETSGEAIGDDDSGGRSVARCPRSGSGEA